MRSHCIKCEMAFFLTSGMSKDGKVCIDCHKNGTSEFVWSYYTDGWKYDPVKRIKEFDPVPFAWKYP